MQQELHQYHFLRDIDCQLADYLCKVYPSQDSILHSIIALLSYAVSTGKVSVSIQALHSQYFSERISLQTMINSLNDWEAIGTEAAYKPIICFQDRLYFYKYYQIESACNDLIQQRLEAAPVIHCPYDITTLNQYFSEADIFKQLAFLMVAQQTLTCIVGKAGTGKTSFIAQLVVCLRSVCPKMRLALATPTGKAAVRLNTLIERYLSQGQSDVTLPQASTVHRLLALKKNGQAGFNESNQLPFDFVLIDEASMLDTVVFHQLLKALPEHARLVLVGDPHQLRPVNVGSIFYDMVTSTPSIYSEKFFCAVQSILGSDFSYATASNVPDMSDHICRFECSYRFQSAQTIQTVTDQLLSANVESFFHALEQSSTAIACFNEEQLNQSAIDLYADYFQACHQQSISLDMLIETFNAVQIICLLNQGTAGALQLNEHIIKHLNHPRDRDYKGKPIILMSNHHQLGLFNGEIGILLEREGRLQACFQKIESDQLSYVWFELNQLSAYRTAYAISLHKSQGSEFQHVMLAFPNIEHPLITVESLYTGLTRAQSRISLFANHTVLKHCLKNTLL